MEEQPVPASTFLVGGQAFISSPHAAMRIGMRQILLDQVIATIAEGEVFRYFHNGAWKDGCYNRSDRLFVGVAECSVTTAIPGASENYIDNLKAGAP